MLPHDECDCFWSRVSYGYEEEFCGSGVVSGIDLLWLCGDDYEQ